jgi:xanthine dehydrogenase accessory factor
VGTDVLELAHEFTNGGEAFALATVVWRRAPSSGKVGYKALITAAGEVSGWVAGACTEPLVVRQALKALKDGEPRVLLIGAPEDLDTRSRDGVLSFPTTCASEGALEIYLEPVLPRPQLVIVGRSPVVDTMASLASALGWRTCIMDDEGGSFSDHTVADKVVTNLDMKGAGVNSRSYVVVATLGHYDEDAIEKALETDASYIGLMASRKRAETVMDYLRDSGVSEESLKRIHAPAGLDLGKIRHEEVAVAVIGEIVQLKALAENAGGPAPGSQQPAEAPAHEHHHHEDAPAEAKPQEAAHVHEGAGHVHSHSNEADAMMPAETIEPGEARDPVCGMAVVVATARYKADYEGETYYFCAPACRKKFQNAPTDYLGVKQHA